MSRAATVVGQHNLPEDLTSLIGRQSDQAEVSALVGSHRVLLVLDNCEHLVQACADLVNRLVRACPRLHVLVTSRELLGVPGEIAWQVAHSLRRGTP